MLKVASGMLALSQETLMKLLKIVRGKIVFAMSDSLDAFVTEFVCVFDQ